MTLRLVSILCLLFAACRCQHNVVQIQAQAPLIVFRLKGDYRNLVPVTMNAERTAITSYPHPSDVKSEKGLRYPLKLKKNYWMDNLGIGPGVAYLDYSLEEYSKMENAPDREDLMAHIRDKDPLESMFRCGTVGDYEDPVKTINEWIRKDSLEAKATRLR